MAVGLFLLDEGGVRIGDTDHQMFTQRFTGQKVFHMVIVKNLKSPVYDADIVFKIVGWHLYLSQPVLTADAGGREPASVHLNQAWNQMLMTLSANCMAVTMSSMLVVSPTCFLSSRLKWSRHVPQTRMQRPVSS